MKRAEPARESRHAEPQPALTTTSAPASVDHSPRTVSQGALAEGVHGSRRAVTQRNQMRAIFGSARLSQRRAPPATATVQRVWAGELADFDVNDPDKLSELENLLKAGYDYKWVKHRAALKDLAAATDTYSNVTELALALKLPAKAPERVAKKKIPALAEEVEMASESVYSTCLEKGKKLVAALKVKLATPPVADSGKTTEEFNAQYTTRRVPDGDGGLDVRSDRTESEYESQYHNKVTDNVTTGGKQIHAETNRKDYDIVGTEEPGKSKTAFSNSEVLFHHFNKAVDGDKEALKKLELVRRANVANKQTRGVMIKLLTEDPSATRFAADSDAYFALLGTENGSAVVFLLTDHALALGLKTVDAVEIVGGTSLAVHLKTFEKPKDETSPIVDTKV